MDGDIGDVDHFVAGFDPSTNKVLVEGTRHNSGGTIVSGLICKSSQWHQFSSKLRDRADRVREDGVGLSLSGFGPLPKAMKTVLNGGNGNDRVVGHGGPDDITGAGGADALIALAGSDVVRSADGIADTVNCGPGQDKATADNKDDLTGCEDVVISRPAP